MMKNNYPNPDDPKAYAQIRSDDDRSAKRDIVGNSNIQLDFGTPFLDDAFWNNFNVSRDDQDELSQCKNHGRMDHSRAPETR
jgi:hypothetical protein